MAERGLPFFQRRSEAKKTREIEAMFQSRGH
jgi:hypothetical protein